MTVEEFDKDESGYKRWLQANRKGYVLNIGRGRDFEEITLHLASCHKIYVYTEPMAPDAFTGRSSVKVCCSNLLELRGWLKRRHVDGFSKTCSYCEPPLVQLEPPRQVAEQPPPPREPIVIKVSGPLPPWRK